MFRASLAARSTFQLVASTLAVTVVLLTLAVAAGFHF